ncbi:hypothetical protein N9408_02970 [Opitutales bacterium]|nr:hypothetical protein [Opitutales bacterium]
MEKSWELAVGYSSNNWIFLLSDDDIIGKEFLSDINFDQLTEDSLYLTRSNIIDESNISKGMCLSPPNHLYEKQKILELFFNHKIQEHLSLMVFHRKIYKKTNGFTFAGYPTGLYIDTIFHGKAFANCDKVFVAKGTVFSRRESSTQQSSKFYSDSRVNEYFDIITKAFMQDPEFCKAVLMRFRSEKRYKEYLIKFRFFVEWDKLHNLIYNKDCIYKTKFLINYFLYWRLSLNFKIFCFIYVFLYPFKKYLGKNVGILKTIRAKL